MLDGALIELAAVGRIDKSWAEALAPTQSIITEIGHRLSAEQATGRGFLPTQENVLRAFRLPLEEVKVLILGQDPYPTPGHPIGLSFAVGRDVRPVPRSLANIYTERHDDLGLAPAGHGDLTAWSDQGVLLLNRVLTVRPGAPASHRGWGWETVTELAIRALVARGRPLVAILWGKQAQSVRPLLAHTPVIASAHPSPLSAGRGFFGSRPFSRSNALLQQQGADAIDWRVAGEDAVG
ncbi:MAG: uracil-DNA glycosylase [Microbacterium sp.]